MTPEAFVRQIRHSVIQENLSIYKNIFASTPQETATDPHWIRALALYAKLNNDETNVLFDIIRQVMVDTISNVFAILDGVSHLEAQEGELSLTANSLAEQINGELQDRFLELEESK